MKNLIFIFRSAIDDFSRNKLRTFLTSLGILIGVFAVVVLIALGLGLKKYISDQFEAMGKNSLFLVPGRVLSGGGFTGSVSSIAGRFDDRDLQTLKKINNVIGVAPLAFKSTKIKGLLKEDFGDIMFSSETFSDIMGLEVDRGRFFDKSDVSKKAKVVVVGSKIAEDYYGSDEGAIGKKITIDDVKFTIIGVTKSKGGGGMGGFDYDSYLFAPYTTGFILIRIKSFSDFPLK